MDQLKSTGRQDLNLLPALINGLAFVSAGASLCLMLADWQGGLRQRAKFSAYVMLTCGLIADFTNRQSKSNVALAQLIEASQARVRARQIQATETVQSADISVESGKSLAELNLGKAHIDAEAAMHLAELEKQYQDHVARVQEFYVEES